MEDGRSTLSPRAKATFQITVPGNHDFWRVPLPPPLLLLLLLLLLHAHSAKLFVRVHATDSALLRVNM